MPATKLRAFLDGHGVRYVSIQHSVAFTASEVAESVHVKGRDFAKTVIVKIGESMAMVVLPASRRIVLHDLREMLGSEEQAAKWRDIVLNGRGFGGYGQT